MVKKSNKRILNVGDIFGIELIDKTWSIVQLCYIFEKDDYLSLTFALFDIQENNFEDILEKIDVYNLSKPIIIATLDEDPKKWRFIKTKNFNYLNVNVKEGITGTWGWYKKTESGIYPKLESYFGILPWDLYLGKGHIENFLIEKENYPKNIKLLKDYSKDEIMKLNIFSLIEYSGRVNELKN